MIYELIFHLSLLWRYVSVIIDLCKEANCHENGHCILQDEKKFANCSCDEGYRGNGTFCTGVYKVFSVTCKSNVPISQWQTFEKIETGKSLTIAIKGYS